MTTESVWIEQRLNLTALAYRITGSWHDAEEVAADAGAALAKADDVRSPQAWLRQVTVRGAIDAARRVERRKETYIGPWLPEPVGNDKLPADTAIERSMLGLGLLRLMQELSPTDRAIFVLREAFGIPYTEIADCVEMTPATCRQTVSRAKRKLGAIDEPAQSDARVITALIAAIVAGDVDETVRLISDDCVLWTDGGGTTKAALRPITGADKAARFLIGIAHKAGSFKPVQVGTNTGIGMWAMTPVGPRLLVIERTSGRITAIQLHGNETKLAAISR